MSGQALATAAAAAMALPGGLLLAGAGARRVAGRALAGSALAVLVGVVAWRWVLLGHPPVFGTYESDLADGAALLLAALWLAGRAPPFVVAAAAVAGGLLPVRGLAHGLNMYPLTISERSWWIDLHAPLGYAAFALLALAGIESVRLAAFRGRAAESGLLGTWLIWGFLLLTGLMATGMVYSSILFGHLWRWDPVEALALAVWLSLGTLVHLRLFFGWSETRIASWAVANTLLVLALFKGLVYLPGGPTYHVFDLRF